MAWSPWRPAILPLAMSGPGGHGGPPPRAPRPPARRRSSPAGRSPGCRPAPTSARSSYLRNQHAELPANRAGGRLAGPPPCARTSAASTDELSKAAREPAQHCTSSTRSLPPSPAADGARLAANPAVQVVVRCPTPFVQRPCRHDRGAGHRPLAASAPPFPPRPRPGLQLVCTPEPRSTPLLEPEALQLTGTEHQPGSGVAAAHDLADAPASPGVSIADGLDINNVDLTRVWEVDLFIDYRTSAVTG